MAGLAYAREGYLDTNRSNLFGQVGLGFTKRLTDTIDFRTDARYQVHGNRAGSGNLGDWVISAGLNIALCPKAQAPAAYVATPAYVATAYVAPAPAPVAATPPPLAASSHACRASAGALCSTRSRHQAKPFLKRHRPVWPAVTGSIHLASA